MKYFFDRKGLGSGLVVVLLLVGMITFVPNALAHDRTRALEQKVQELENMLRAVQGELQQVRTESDSKAVEAKQTAVEAKAQATAAREEVSRVSSTTTAGTDKRHRVFFRGGWARSDHTHNAVSIESRVAPVGAQDRADRDAWYIGAGLDFSLTNDVWGLMPRTEVLAEVMFEYKNFQTGVAGNALGNEPTQLAGFPDNPRGVTVSQFTLTAAPKIKFMEGSKFRPWIIPAGLAIHVISPPSESITVLDPGVMFGGGAEYNVWKDIYIGADARYHYTVGTLDGAKIDGLTLGGYIGMGW
ncbi:MAG: porin family protein [Nitrosomonas sp.]|nr:porin family protein [Nitrosomonas sp.]